MNTTPAPWTILGFTGWSPQWVITGELQTSGRHSVICQVTACDEAEANAQLIAAAPQLLEALLLIVKEPGNELLDTHRQCALEALALVSEEIAS